MIDKGEFKMSVLEEIKSVKLYFEERHRGLGHSVWKACNSFVLHKDFASHCILHVFDKDNISFKKAEKILIDDDYVYRIAKGMVCAEIQEWRFIEPSDSANCKHVLKKMIADPEVLRYYKGFRAVAPNGEDLGIISDYEV